MQWNPNWNELWRRSIVLTSFSKMTVFITSEERFVQTADGRVWSGGAGSYSFWKRYLGVFGQVRVIARIANATTPPGSRKRADGEGVTFDALPCYMGPLEYTQQFFSIKRAIRKALSRKGAVIMRVPSPIAHCVERELASGHPFGLEVVGDPYEVFAPGVVDHPLRPFFRWHFSRHLRRQCLHAVGVAYVTKRILQERYPPQFMSMSISSIELGSAHIAECAGKPKQHGPYQLVTVGSLAQLYKGTDVLIEAVARSVRAGLDLTAVIVGDGKYRPDLMAQAERLGMASRIQFPGQVTAGEPVRRILDTAALFVLPSRTEGLPRALIEAMARGLPCIGSAVGGIPELLDASDLVPAGDPAALAAKIQDVLSDPLKMETMSRRNLAGAREFCDSVLAERRRCFYQHVRDCTQRWELQQKA